MDNKNKLTTPNEDNSIVGDETTVECSNGRGDDEDVDDL